jgi:hypothetical protein
MVRRLVLALTVVAVVAGASIGTPSLTVSGLQVSHGPELAKAQPGATIYCGDYKTAYYISSGEYWYARVFR